MTYEEGTVMNFRSLVSTTAWHDLIERGRRRIYDSKKVILAQGDSPEDVFVLVDGLVKVAQSDEHGNNLTLMLRGPGEVLGEMGVLLGRPRSVTVTAARRCTTAALTAHTFRSYVDEHGLRNAAYGLAVERFTACERLQSDLRHLPPTGRIARVVTALADEVGRPQGQGYLLVDLAMDRTELAGMASMSRSSALAALGRLQSVGVLRLGRQRLTIIDPARLRAVARGEQFPEYLGVEGGTPSM
ncbi:Crp/Fnr family transcriptional regulator [Streptomyces sp. MBT60]|uniref:Crp/Fnr family transcriptional regulator n=1 Tax=Streptomyces sp. MBT60 TaxID=2800409 RepID=UPI00190C8F15|nr:Crp/Fnr family transcriptional regulator [Streptomyces sp. MBT60]MBK3545588.1 Crp/Fnr family transcriptional regulator [Streptomyces sp. MBT60]